MTFANFVFSISFSGQTSFFKNSRITAQTHRAAVFACFYESFLLRHYIYDGIFSFWVNFGSVGALHAQNIARIFNNGELHAVAKTEIRNLVFPRETNGFQFAFYARLAEASGRV